MENRKEIEKSIFYAKDSYTSRVRELDSHQIRNDFQRDRDRISIPKNLED